MNKDKKEDRDMETPVVAQPTSFLKTLGLETRIEAEANRTKRQLAEAEFKKAALKLVKQAMDGDITSLEALRNAGLLGELEDE